jgi:hypothetical protein
MQPLNLPTYSFNLKSEEGSDLIFDEFRSRWVALTPEEWVRQNVARYLVAELGYPSSLMLLEQKIRMNGMARRCDIVVYSRSGIPVLLVECKAPEVAVNQKVFDQVARYNLVLGVMYLLVTNGLVHYCIQYGPDSQQYSFLPGIPGYSAIATQSS